MKRLAYAVVLVMLGLQAKVFLKHSVNLQRSHATSNAGVVWERRMPVPAMALQSTIAVERVFTISVGTHYDDIG